MKAEPTHVEKKHEAKPVAKKEAKPVEKPVVKKEDKKVTKPVTKTQPAKATEKKTEKPKKVDDVKKINETPMYVRPFLEDPIFLQPDDFEVA